jgi:CRP-like cAMP-binding protein
MITDFQSNGVWTIAVAIGISNADIKKWSLVMTTQGGSGINGRHQFSAGETIFNEGEEANEVFVIVSGTVEFFLKGVRIGEENEGGLVGEMALINETVRSATAVAKSECVLDTIDRDQFLALIKQSPDFALHVMRVMADRLRLINEIVSK